MMKSLDALIPNECAYVRYMDDWVILTKTGRKLRSVIKKLHALLHALKLNIAVDKTYIGKTSNGFDFLGYRFDHLGLCGIAAKTLVNHLQKLALLYEQHASPLRMRQYRIRWLEWTSRGIDTRTMARWVIRTIAGALCIRKTPMRAQQ